MKNKKSPYLGCGSTDFDQIWHGNAVRRSALLSVLTVKISKKIEDGAMLNKNSSEDETANVNFCTTTSYNTSKYNPLLNIQHDAGRGTASGCGLVVLGPQGETFGNH